MINPTSVSASEPTHLPEVSIPPVSKLDTKVDESRILDLITQLQQLGIEDHYELPQIIVCGSQSAGKSSVLQAITGIPFPTASHICTKFVTQITLKRIEHLGEVVEVRIQPADDSDRSRIARLRRFQRQVQGPDCLTRLSSILQEAKDWIFEDVDKAKLVTKDVVQVTIAGPNKRPLQVFDLPGLMGTDTGKGEREDVKKITEKYMRMTQSIILAVVRANDDINGPQAEVLGWARDKFDREGKRTIGVITHPDQAGARESQWIRLLQGESTQFHLKNQWHVLRNPSDEEDVRPQQRDEWERNWFQESAWCLVPETRRGASSLLDYLCNLLTSRLSQRLPGLHNHLSQSLLRIDSELDQLRSTSPTERVRVFRERMELLRTAASNHAQGSYDFDIYDAFASDTGAYLRARVVRRGEQLRDDIINHGHAWESHIASAAAGPDTDLRSFGSSNERPQNWSTPLQLYENVEEEIKAFAKDLMQTRGQELPGHINPDRIKTIFWRRSNPWPEIAELHIEGIIKCCKEYLQMMAEHHFKVKRRVRGVTGFANADAVAKRYIDQYVASNLEERRRNALEELERLDTDRKGTLINYDFAFLEEQRNYLSQQLFGSTMKAFHVLEARDATDGGSPEPLECRKFAQAAGHFSQEEQINHVASRFLHDAAKHYIVSVISTAVPS